MKTCPAGSIFVELSNKQAAEQLLVGNLEAAFIVDNYEPQTVKKLLKGKDIKIMNVALADAYLKYLSFFIVGYSAYKLLTFVRLFPSKFLMNNMFLNLRELDEAVAKAVTKEQIQDIADALRSYEKEIYENRIVEKNSRFYFNLKNVLSGVKRDTQDKLKALSG